MTSSKKHDLVDTARQSVRTPRPAPQSDVAKGGYRVVAVSLYTPEAEWIDQVTKALHLAGHTKANRSLVVREAILRLWESLGQKEPSDILTDFIQHQARRTTTSS